MSASQSDDGERWDTLVDDLRHTRFGDVRRVTQTGSTNVDVGQLARAGAPEGIVLVADHQTAGRGRLGRSWVAPPRASLLVSILVRPSVAVTEGHLVTTALGVAAAEACRVAGVPAGLKWPNDLVVEDDEADGRVRKLSGMLAESVVEDGRVGALVLGIGLNVNWPDELPPELADIAIAMNHVVGHDLSRPSVLAELLHRFDHWYGSLSAPEGRRGLTGRYRELSATIGRRVQIELGSETVVGDAVDISDDGHLLVVEDHLDRPREIVAGDVVHLRRLR